MDEGRGLGDALREINKEIKGGGGPAACWPIGSIFLSVSPTNPGISLGCGTWVRFGAGKVLVGLDSSDVSFDTAEEIGGTKTSTPEGTVSQPTFTGSPLPAHDHGTGTLAASVHAGVTVQNHSYTPAGTINAHTTAGDSNTTGGTAKVTGPGTHTFTGTAANLTHTVTQPNNHTLSGRSESLSAGTPAGTVSQPNFVGSPMSVLQPFIVVYMFKRVS